jgi:hypothetical protein
LDVDIDSFGIELRQMPNQSCIGIEFQYQSYSLDVMQLLDGIL